MVSFYKKEVVSQHDFDKSKWWRDGFWRYARFKNMPFYFRVSHKGRRGGGRYIWYLVFYGNTFVEMYGQFKIKNLKKHCKEDISDVKNI